ncbi:diaminopropionate ammonia-lyase [Clostridium sp. UBA4548]|uniref:diaminopropionate ammonia-lyase n=1 Tax=Clostridium sp. UBA4548 TaxID=1946361 RepID=UPI0025BB53D4|nr:diaminopropionate ammonia-lyase [Clostridium sp. UBA4548]
MSEVTNKIQFIQNKRYKPTTDKCPKFLSGKELKKVRHIHDSIPQCKATPLVHLTNLSEYLGVKSIFVKNESKRGSINSFKILGATYGISKLICDLLGIEVDKITFDFLKTEEIREKIQEITLATCSDGNHGRGVAWTANQLGLRAIIYMPKGTTQSRVKNIEALGAEVIVTDLNYDDTVRYVNKIANKNNWYIVQDTSWEGYEEVPNSIIQGYSTMGMEAIEQLQDLGVQIPTHIFVQAGVGAMAGGVIGAIANYYNGKMPITIVMEPTNAACYFKSAEINDGMPHNVSGNLESIMAGLACGEPVKVGWKIIRDFVYGFCTCPDYITANGMRILGNPLGEDERIIAGESAGIGIGLLSMIMINTDYGHLKQLLNLNKESVILIFSTEGDTDPTNYRRIVWDGAFSFIEG